MAVLLTQKLIADCAESYEFGDARQRRKCFEKLREHGEESLRLIARLNHAIEQLQTQRRTSMPSDRSDPLEYLRSILGGK